VGGGGLSYHDPVDLGLSGSEFHLFFGPEHVLARSPLPGLHTIPAALCAIAVCYAMGMSLPQATAALASADLREGRMQVRQSDTGATILDDRYNSSPASLAGALLLLRGREGRRIALLGRMAELGEYEEGEHEKIGALAAGCCDLLFAVGLPCKAMVEAAHAAGLAAAYWFEDKREAAVAVRERLAIGDTVLVKASRSQEFETIIPFLEGAA
jgi:UDP-N-acetylmuramoyl-tripeptide--D-alanyl-D-alanine ligase